MELYAELGEYGVYKLALRTVHTHSANNIASRRQTSKTDSKCTMLSFK